MSLEHAGVYLLEYLKDEFRRYPEVRIRQTPEDKEVGITVKTESRDYFFPVEWMRNKRFDQITKEIARIKVGLPDRG